MTVLLPKTIHWIVANKDQGWQKTFFEYYYNIEYHFNHAEGVAKSTMYSINQIKGVKVGDTHARIEGFTPQSAILFGDIAVREASSVIETTLIMINYVLSLNVSQKNMQWKPKDKNDDKSLKLAMLKHTKLASMVTLIDSIYDSAAYILLAQYRNWVTHRGAPQTNTTFDLNQPILIPSNIMNEGSIDQVNERITNYLRINIPKHVNVICYPFIHKVNEDIGTPKESDPNLNVTDLRTTKRSLFDDKKDFNKNNPIPIAQGEMTIAGEELRIYKLLDYISGVQEVIIYIHQLLSRRLDNELHKVLSS